MTVKDLAGHNVRAERVTGSKWDRAQPFAAQCEAGNVKLLRGKWNRAYLDELSMFPHAAHDDQVDASSGAFNKVVRRHGPVTIDRPMSCGGKRMPVPPELLDEYGNLKEPTLAQRLGG